MQKIWKASEQHQSRIAGTTYDGAGYLVPASVNSAGEDGDPNEGFMYKWNYCYMRHLFGNTKQKCMCQWRPCVVCVQRISE